MPTAESMMGLRDPPRREAKQQDGLGADQLDTAAA